MLSKIYTKLFCSQSIKQNFRNKKTKIQLEYDFIQIDILVLNQISLKNLNFMVIRHTHPEFFRVLGFGLVRVY